VSEKASGLDVSHYQEDVDWARVAKIGKVFAFLKASEGALISDALFETNRAGARKNNIIVGAYHLFHPGRAVADQVKLFVGQVKALEPGELPPVLDLEVPDEWNPVTPTDRLKLISAWLEQVEDALGVKPIIYAARSFVDNLLKNDSRLAAYGLWLADYRVRPTLPVPWSDWVFWQFTDQGVADGITGNVDLDLFNGSLRDLEKLQALSPSPAVVTAARSVAGRSVHKQTHPLAALIDASSQVEAARRTNPDAAQRRVLAEARRYLDRAVSTLTPRPRPWTRLSRKRRVKAARRRHRHSTAKRGSRPRKDRS
jgi:lysozyme